MIKIMSKKINTFEYLDLIIEGKIQHKKYGNYKNASKDIKELIIKDFAKVTYKQLFT